MTFYPNLTLLISLIFVKPVRTSTFSVFISLVQPAVRRIILTVSLQSLFSAEKAQFDLVLKYVQNNAKKGKKINQSVKQLLLLLIIMSLYLSILHSQTIEGPF